MKKNTLTYVLIAGGIVAAFLIIRRMNKDKKRLTSTVEAGPTEKITEEEFEEAVVTTPTTKPGIPAILDVVKSLKRSPEQKAAAQKRKAVKKFKKTKEGKAVTTFLNMPKSVRGIDEISVLY